MFPEAKSIHGCLQVGSQFVNQYYTVMKSSPKYLHRFYNDNSTFTFVDPGHSGSPSPYSFTARSQKVRLSPQTLASAFSVSPRSRCWLYMSPHMIHCEQDKAYDKAVLHYCHTFGNTTGSPYLAAWHCHEPCPA